MLIMYHTCHLDVSNFTKDTFYRLFSKSFYSRQINLKALGFTKRLSDQPLSSWIKWRSNVFLNKGEENHMKSIVSIALWQVFLGDTLIRFGEKVTVWFCVWYLSQLKRCLKLRGGTAFLMGGFDFCKKSCEMLPHTCENSTEAIKKTVITLYSLATLQTDRKRYF
jgi:hypothetical protein